MISRGGRGSRGNAIEPKMCSSPAKGLPGTALIPCADFFFIRRRAVTFFLALVETAVGMEAIEARVSISDKPAGASNCSRCARAWPQVETLLPAHKLVNVYADRVEGIG